MDHTKFTRQTYLVVVFLNEYIEVQWSFLFINYKPNSEPGILLLELWVYHYSYLFRISEIELLFNYNTCNSGINSLGYKNILNFIPLAATDDLSESSKAIYITCLPKNLGKVTCLRVEM